MKNIACRRQINICLLFFFFSTLISVIAQGLTSEIVVNLKNVVQVSLNPSGKKVAYVVRAPREAQEKPGGSYSELWVVNIKGKKAPRKYISKSNHVRSVSWSPDGRWITFLAKRKKQNPNTQIYRMQADGGEAVLLTRHIASINAYHYSPDGKWIAFVAVDPLTKEEKKAKKEGQDWKVYDENLKCHRLWLMNVASGEIRKLYEQELNIWSFVWTPDSKNLVVQATEKPLIDDSYMFRKIYRIPVKAGNPELLCETKGKLGLMDISPDGKQLAFVGASSLNDPLPQSLFVVSMKGGYLKNLTPKIKFTAQWAKWLDNKMLLLASIKGTRSVFHKVNVANAKIRALITSGPMISNMDIHRKSKRFAAIANTPSHPSEVYAGKINLKKMTRLTHHNPELNSVKFSRQEVFQWKGADNWDIEGILTYPLGYKKGQRYPLVLQIHGGPEGVNLNGWSTNSLYPVQVLAAKGYFVLQPNYRGSAGKGVAFSKADHDDLGGKEFNDVLAGIDALIKDGLVDSERVGTGGWSYGGYFSAWAATRHSQRFKASMMCAGISNWISFAGVTDIPYEMSIVHWNSWWYDKSELHWERSPLYHINNAATPTLIIHGMVDKRVPPEQGIELYTALKLKKIPTKLVLYPREPHGLMERAHQLDYMKRTIEWFDQYLKGKIEKALNR